MIHIAQYLSNINSHNTCIILKPHRNGSVELRTGRARGKWTEGKQRDVVETEWKEMDAHNFYTHFIHILCVCARLRCS